MVQRHKDQSRGQQTQEADQTDVQAARKVKVVGLSCLSDDVRPGNTYAKENIKHRASETGRKAHDRGEHRHCHVRHEIG